MIHVLKNDGEPDVPEEETGPTGPDEATGPNDLTATNVIEKLGVHGLLVSICYGPTGPDRRIMWTVTVLTPLGQSFDSPFAAKSLRQAAEIARLECEKRGWYKEEVEDDV